ncbi:unnamed protein product [Paramecium pentaurelia]|uniref:Uncharacterized protein n=1 Tax=Paramecium pentaurelia TaxID=43138 RepID=A0A8S1TWW4_9CILI|nr:unnamed protein product [Paramecium pentaurelia]
MVRQIQKKSKKRRQIDIQLEWGNSFRSWWIQQNNCKDILILGWIEGTESIAKQVNKNGIAQVYENGEYFRNQKFGRWQYQYKQHKIYNYSQNNQWRRFIYQMRIEEWEMDSFRGKDFWINLKQLILPNIAIVTKLLNGIFDLISMRIIKLKNEVVDVMIRKAMSLNQVYKWRFQINLKFHLQQHILVNINLVKILANGIFGIVILNCGGLYEKSGDEMNIANWIEVLNENAKIFQLMYYGIHKNGQTIGRCDTRKTEGQGNQRMNTTLQTVKVKCSTHKFEASYQNIFILFFFLIPESSRNMTEYCIFKKVQKIYFPIFLNPRVPLGDFHHHGSTGPRVSSSHHLALTVLTPTQSTSILPANSPSQGEWPSQDEKRRFGHVHIPQGVSELRMMKAHLTENYHMARVKFFFQFGFNLSDLRRGGFYDDEGDGMKVGKRVEVSDRFPSYPGITYHGEYKNNQKVGIWDMWYMYLMKVSLN